MDAILAAIDAALSEQQRKAQAAQTTARPGPLPPPVAPRAVAPPQAKPAVAEPAPHGAPPAAHAGISPLQGMFSDGNSLLRSIIAAEVLGPCLALGHAQDKPK